MLMQDVNGQQLEQIISTGDIVFIDFWAEWCAPCKVFAKVYARIAEQYPLLHFAQVNIEKETDLAETFQIRSIPHLIVFKQGIIIYSESGSMPESAFKALVEQAIQVDMDEIRNKMDNNTED